MIGLMLRNLPNGVAQRITALYFKARCVGRGFHSTDAVVDLDKMKIRILPALKDNYMYLIIDEQTKQAAVVDPVEPDTVLAAVKEEGATLTKVLTTHHHWDHAGGNDNLVKHVPSLEVFGGDERINCLTNKVSNNDTLCIGSLDVQCLFTPCHTKGHMCYYITSAEGDNAVFTGDTLFIGGCGRFFEGTAEQMCHAMSVLGSLPDETKVFCGHEYTMQNLKFAKKVDPTNKQVEQAIKWASDLRNKNTPTVPSSIAKEKMINPFMRVDDVCVQQYAGHTGCKVRTMAEIRRQKDSFSG
ncbi:hydroxyacylglutathione hydrolase, mitochondrial-like isoform X1 [Ctenocephalides felis]|uniref:hydroxyacylglutathione hydrolase, mitochondrial-like isoform X1 n=3 Tax=Ctenocephalides felis TaxID=7515 RepID=UPI000E6E4F86|nr:hydroxyacylglutathione hydrolase, mitochondrial-like isoform X1 [Ctenocephalides felis]